MTIEFAEAKKIAYKYANRYSRNRKEELVLPDEAVVERSYGWYFMPVSATSLETGNPLDSIVGPGPILVRKDTKEVFQFGSANDLEYYIGQYENTASR
jgi:hypothetical protein